MNEALLLALSCILAASAMMGYQAHETTDEYKYMVFYMLTGIMSAGGFIVLFLILATT